MTDPEFGGAYGFPDMKKLYEAFHIMREISKAANLALEKFGGSMLQTTICMKIRQAFQDGEPWILHHAKSGMEYIVAGFRPRDGMFLMPVGDDGVRRAIPVAHVLSGHYALWGN